MGDHGKGGGKRKLSFSLSPSLSRFPRPKKLAWQGDIRKRKRGKVDDRMEGDRMDFCRRKVSDGIEGRKHKLFGGREKAYANEKGAVKVGAKISFFVKAVDGGKRLCNGCDDDDDSMR